jgi:Mg/Co/Ni transporter MgtE
MSEKNEDNSIKNIFDEGVGIAIEVDGEIIAHIEQKDDASVRGYHEAALAMALQSLSESTEEHLVETLDKEYEEASDVLEEYDPDIRWRISDGDQTKWKEVI